MTSNCFWFRCGHTPDRLGLTAQRMTEIIAVIEQKTMAQQNSSKARGDETLARVTAFQAQRFLTELANLRNSLESISRFENKYGHFMPQHQRHFVDYVDPSSREGIRLLVDDRNVVMWSTDLQYALRAIWKAPDLRTKDWSIFRLVDELEIEGTNPHNERQFGVLAIEGGQIKALAPPSALEQIFLYLRKRAHKLDVCSNGGCPAPYFFSTRKSQKYCSEVCAQPSQREFKRKWWAECGNARRRAKKQGLLKRKRKAQK